MKPSINPYDSRVDAVTLTDLDNQNRIISTHRTVAEARTAQAELLFDPARAFGDVQLRRFPMATAAEALATYVAMSGRHEWRWQYLPSEWAEMRDAAGAAVLVNYGVLPELDDDPDDADPTGQLGDDEDDQPDSDIDDDEQPDDAPAYSLPYVTMLGLPRDGELEQRRPWVPDAPADRRPHR